MRFLFSSVSRMCSPSISDYIVVLVSWTNKLNHFLDFLDQLKDPSQKKQTLPKAEKCDIYYVPPTVLYIIMLSAFYGKLYENIFSQ